MLGMIWRTMYYTDEINLSGGTDMNRSSSELTLSDADVKIKNFLIDCFGV